MRVMVDELQATAPRYKIVSPSEIKIDKNQKTFRGQ
jgi:hypothetical protein